MLGHIDDQFQFLSGGLFGAALTSTLTKVIIEGISDDFPKLVLAKLSETSINLIENIDEVEKIILLTTFTTKLHR